jgi:hypothetical protein
MVFVATENGNITCRGTKAFIIDAKIHLAPYDKYDLVAIMKVGVFIERMG